MAQASMKLTLRCNIQQQDMRVERIEVFTGSNDLLSLENNQEVSQINALVIQDMATTKAAFNMLLERVDNYFTLSLENPATGLAEISYILRSESLLKGLEAGVVIDGEAYALGSAYSEITCNRSEI